MDKRMQLRRGSMVAMVHYDACVDEIVLNTDTWLPYEYGTDQIWHEVSATRMRELIKNGSLRVREDGRVCVSHIGPHFIVSPYAPAIYAAGVVAYDVATQRVYIGDGQTFGGIELL